MNRGSREEALQRRCGASPALALAIMLVSVVVTSASFAGPPATGLVNTLHWATDSEVDVFGFYVYRARENGGDFVKLNDMPVTARGGADIGARYRYEDRDIEAGVRYRYYVKQLTNSGREERLTPVLVSEPKFPTE